MTPVSIIFICEQAEQVTGSGCCGKLGGDTKELCGSDAFDEQQSQRKAFGILHRAVREFFPPVDGQDQIRLASVDPRNQLYLVPKLWRDVLFYRPGWKSGLMTMLQLFSVPAIVVNGKVVTRRGQPLHPDDLCHLVRKHLDRQGKQRSASVG